MSIKSVIGVGLIIILGGTLFSHALTLPSVGTTLPCKTGSIYLPQIQVPFTETEPNDEVAVADGPLQSGMSYSGYPNDTNDNFFIDVTVTGTIVVDLINHTGNGTQVQLLYETKTNRVAYAPGPSYHIEYDAQRSGRYYIFIYTPSGHNQHTPYTLTVTYPTPSQLNVTPIPIPTCSPSPTATATPTPTFTPTFTPTPTFTFTPTPTPTPTFTPTPSEPILPLSYELFDDFETLGPPDGRWFVENLNNPLCGTIQQDGYLSITCEGRHDQNVAVSLKPSFNYKRPFPAIAIAAKTLSLGSENNVEINFTFKLNGESVRVYSLSLYGVAIRARVIFPQENWRYELLQERSLGINDNIHVLQIVYTEPNDISFYLNGEYLTLIQDPKFVDGSILDRWEIEGEVHQLPIGKEENLESRIYWVAFLDPEAP